MKWRHIWLALALAALAGCTSTSIGTLASPKPSPSVLPSPFAVAWAQECGLGSSLPPAGLLGISERPPVSAVGVSQTQAQTWTDGLLRTLALKQWAEANLQDTVLSSGCLGNALAANDDLLAIAQAKAQGGSVDYESGTLSNLSVRAATSNEKEATGDNYAIEATGTGPAGLWVVDSQGLKVAVGSVRVDAGQEFKVAFVGHYNDQTGVWALDATIECEVNAPCS
jgi:hypothetical protein